MIELNWNGKKKISDLDINNSVVDYKVAEFLCSSGDSHPDITEHSVHKLILDCNLLYYSDNLSLLFYLNKHFANSIDLIYLDPPFYTGNSFDVNRSKMLSVCEDKTSKIHSFDDYQNKPLSNYLDDIYIRLQLMRNLLSKRGSIYVHLDWHCSHYVKIILDEIFGTNNFVNEIVWYYYNKYSKPRHSLPRSHDTILVYSKTGNHILNSIREKRDKPVKQLLRESVNGVLKNKKDKNGKTMYRTVHDKKIDDVWKIPQLQYASSEWTGFETQKHNNLLKRIIELGSDENSIVADFYCGSGTTFIEAEKLGRKWIGCDSSRIAISTTRKRLHKHYTNNDMARNVCFFYNSTIGYEIENNIDVFHSDITSKLSENNIIKNNKYNSINIIFNNDLEKKYSDEEYQSIINIDNYFYNISNDKVLCYDIKHNDFNDSSFDLYHPSSLTIDVILNHINNNIFIDIEINNFIPYRNINNTKIHHINNFADSIDSWGICIDTKKNNFFYYDWFEYRISRKYDIILTSNMNYKIEKNTDYYFWVKVFDIYGFTTNIFKKYNYFTKNTQDQ